MDWEGQRLAEYLMQIILLAGGAVAFGAGFLYSSFALMMYIHLGATLLACLVVVPDWPVFRRHPLTWLEPRPAESTSTVQEMLKARVSKKAGKAKK
ncbi:hypothetical protein CLOM_g18331 [Closterium sp. NIES-68]|nr:hypothetical protein CLOM_g6960 [Closterium sp. NIES-68]GJP33824.1 hypothetical protein CLOM_g18331 [Closterium sp. NIES-68]GJP65812.1 hypothetical protein CLOP_g22728 [Closterium sp. NIES-67]